MAYSEEELKSRYGEQPDLLTREEKERQESRGTSPEIAQQVEQIQELRDRYRAVITATVAMGGPNVREKIKEIRLRHYDEAAAADRMGLDDREVAKGRRRLIQEIDSAPDTGSLQQNLITNCLDDFQDFVDFQTGRGREREAQELDLAERYPDMPPSQDVIEIKGLEAP